MLLILLCCLLLSISTQAQEHLKPVLHEDWWQIADNPDLDTLHSDEQQPVDFGIWQAADGTWQLWSCIRKTKEIGRTRLFYGWEGETLNQEHWPGQGIKMRADTSLGEHPGGMQAPFVINQDGKYLMFYGDWNRICLAESTDGKRFNRKLIGGDPALFGDLKETNTRDAMVIKADGKWICYYVAHPNNDGAIYARTSHDLLQWSESKIVSYGGHVGKGKLWQAECPFVVKMGADYFLFRTEKYGEDNKTNIYRSPDPLDFGIDDDRYFIGSIPVAAPEFFEYQDTWYIACLLPSLQGVRLGKLSWEADP
ncbi:MAG: hypothetical protein HKN76_03750 [Saprospiraceae bacterium]|nr:hypothetical protein [Saprospiraceae bacterium]